MRAAGIRRTGDTAGPIDLPEPRALHADEVLLDVRACGVGHWDEFVRTGGWDTGPRPPMAMGVEAAGLVAAVGDAQAGPDSAGRLLAAGALAVLDYHDPGWPDRARSVLGGGADAAVNAAPSGSHDTVRAVRDGGRLATITADAPPAERGITAVEILVAPDGPGLTRLARLLAQGVITVAVGARYPLEQAAAAMDRIRQGTHGTAVVLQPGAGNR